MLRLTDLFPLRRLRPLQTAPGNDPRLVSLLRQKLPDSRAGCRLLSSPPSGCTPVSVSSWASGLLDPNPALWLHGCSSVQEPVLLRRPTLPVCERLSLTAWGPLAEITGDPHLLAAGARRRVPGCGPYRLLRRVLLAHSKNSGKPSGSAKPLAKLRSRCLVRWKALGSLWL